MVELRLDGEKLLRCIKRIESELNVIRADAALGVAEAPSVQGIDLTKIDWKDKYSEPASAGDPWAWAFGYDQDGTYRPESKALVQAIEQYGKMVIDGFEMTLSGRDGKLLNRKKVKAKR